jgi:hypothetical protein
LCDAQDLRERYHVAVQRQHFFVRRTKKIIRLWLKAFRQA